MLSSNFLLIYNSIQEAEKKALPPKIPCPVSQDEQKPTLEVPPAEAPPAVKDTEEKAEVEQQQPEEKVVEVDPSVDEITNKLENVKVIKIGFN